MTSDSLDLELAAVKVIYEALAPLTERGRQFVLKTVADRLVTGEHPGGGGATRHDKPPAKEGGMNPPVTPSSNGQTVKEFLKEKRPITDVQRIACLAYYLTHFRNQTQFTTKDLRKINTDAGETAFSNPSMAVMNATRQNGYLSPVGGGKKQITTFGEDVVTALPGQEAVKVVVSARRKRRKRPARRTASKT